MSNLTLSDFNRRNISFGLFRLYKGAAQRVGGLVRGAAPAQTVLFILGIQRA